MGMGALAVEMGRRGRGEWGRWRRWKRRERERGWEERESPGQGQSEEERRGWETGCLQLSCGSVGAEPHASAVPTRAYVGGIYRAIC
jgi:hypothetical protein